MIRRALVRALVFAGVAHIVELLLAGWLWRNRRQVVEQLAEAATELGRRPPAK